MTSPSSTATTADNTKNRSRNSSPRARRSKPPCVSSSPTWAPSWACRSDARLMSLTAAKPILWQPHPGPQTAFLTSMAYEVLYGGQAGGGKSDALLYGGLQQIAHPDYKALILRRTFPELRELIDRSMATFPQMGGVWTIVDHRWRFPSGATYQFGYCGSYAEAMQYQGQQYTWIGYDEIGQLPEERVWLFLMSRNRVSSPGLIRMMRASANPGGPGHHWLKRRFISRCPDNGTPITVALDQGVRDGKTISRAFIKATLSDNPALIAADPEYEQRLRLLPELEYRWLAKGDWDAGAGLGLIELARDKHLVPPIEVVPSHWTIFCGFDWGYAHPFFCGVFCCDDGGGVYLLDSVAGRHLQPPDIVLRILDRLQAFGIPRDRVRYTAAGHDCWADHKSRLEHVPTIAEEFSRLGLPLRKANISRIAGVQNIRRYLRWKERHALTDVEHEVQPRFRICDTPMNRRVYECLESRVSDPTDPEDILKTDADERGEGGDDAYDMIRYGLASRPIIPALQEMERQKEQDRAGHFNISKKRFEYLKPAEELAQLFAPPGGRPRHSAPVRHRLPVRKSS